MEKPRVTEIKVRMDCNGCVQKIKKALNGITGIHDIYVDFPQQKITIIGWADPEKIVKAIKKTRKSAVICLHTEQPDQPTEPAPEGEAPPPEPTGQQPEPTQPEPTPPENAEPPKEPPQPENPPPESPEIANATPRQSGEPSKPKDQEEIHVIHHHPTDYGYRYAYGPNFQQGPTGQWNAYHGGPQFRDGPSHPPQQPQPIYVTHSYNTHSPSPCVTEYANPRSPPRYSRYSAPDNYTHYSAPDNYSRYSKPENYSRYSAPDNYTRYSAPDNYTRYSAPDNYTRYSGPDNYARYSGPENNTHYGAPDNYTRYSAPDNYSQDYYRGNNGNGNGNITSMFSEEDPNACRIV